MDQTDFRRIALSFAGVVEGAHMGAADFRVRGRIFATLAAADHGYGNLMLGPGQQASLVDTFPEVFVPIRGGWGRMGATHVILATASEDQLAAALQMAYELRVEKNARTRSRRGRPGPGSQS